jgi:hypothetical protein
MSFLFGVLFIHFFLTALITSSALGNHSFNKTGEGAYNKQFKYMLNWCIKKVKARSEQYNRSNTCKNKLLQEQLIYWFFYDVKIVS